MNLTRFKTKKVLWVATSIFAFGICWLYPMQFGKEGTYALGKLWLDFFRDPSESWLPLAILSVVFGVLGGLVGFAVQALVVIVQRRKAQLAAAPNGGPIAPPRNSAVFGGPPSVS
jgi:hypothetical protein